jgi:hypothetical protein
MNGELTEKSEDEKFRRQYNVSKLRMNITHTQKTNWSDNRKLFLYGKESKGDEDHND